MDTCYFLAQKQAVAVLFSSTWLSVLATSLLRISQNCIKISQLTMRQALLARSMHY